MPANAATPAPILTEIHTAVRRVHTLQHEMALPLSPYGWMAERSTSTPFRLYVRGVWRQRRWRLYLLHLHRPWPSWWYPQAMCVHSHEGAWTDNTGNGYTGGLQFLDSTWIGAGGARYAPRAYLATPDEQLIVAYHVWQRDGGSFREWGTAGVCGLG